jgi:hypothetical protein
VEFLFQVSWPPAQLPMSSDALGKTYNITLQDMAVEITIPRERDDFLFWKPFIPGEYQAVLPIPVVGETRVQVIRVTVAATSDVSAEAAAASLEALRQAVKAIDSAREVAERAITEFLAWIRATTRLTGMSLSSEVPPLAGPVRVIEIDTGRLFNTGPSMQAVGESRDPEGKYILIDEDLRHISENISTGAVAPIAETLLADAEYFVSHPVTDFRRAVLMAAIACEVKAKEVLRALATEEQQPLLDFALGNPREITVTAAGGLFDKLMDATAHRSLRREDRDLFKQIEELYTVRNGIAHSGRMPDQAQTNRAVRAARRCFTWLDSLAPPARDSP